MAGSDLKVPILGVPKLGGEKYFSPPTSIKNSNFVVFQNHELRFSEIFCRCLKRPFPGYFLYPASVEGVPFFLRNKFKITDPNLKILASEHGDFTFCDGFWLDL